MRVALSGPFNALLARKDTQSQFSQRVGLHSFATMSLKLVTWPSFSRRKSKVEQDDCILSKTSPAGKPLELCKPVVVAATVLLKTQ